MSNKTGVNPVNRQEQEPSMPYVDPRLEFKMAMNLMGEKMAREYLEWLFLDEATGQLPPDSEERIHRILERTLGHKKHEQVEPQSA